MSPAYRTEAHISALQAAGRITISTVWIAIGGYVVGVLVALWRTDAAWPIRAAVALLWPIGPAAFILTVLLLLAASTIAFPVVGALVAVSALLAAWWVL